MQIKIYTPETMLEKSREIGALRIEIFREWPYLYEGEIEEASTYLKDYIKDESGRLITLENEGEILGMVTGIAVAFYDAHLLAETSPRYYYWGDFILKKAYRGHQLGQQLFDAAREVFKTLDFDTLLMAMIKRDAFDPRRPKEARDMREFAKKVGFKSNGVSLFYKWREIGEEIPVEHELECFEMKNC